MTMPITAALRLTAPTLRHRPDRAMPSGVAGVNGL
jgi:hypothetical protein